MAGSREAEEFTRLAGGLPQEDLVWLVARQACEDRVFAARLRAAAGELQAPTPEELRTVRNLIKEAAAIPDSAYEWDLHDIYRAGLDLVRELQVLAQHPANDGMLAVVEYAAEVWDQLAGYLHDAWETYETEPGEIGEALRTVHLDVCRRLKPDPMELAERLADLAGKASFDSCLDDPHAYAPILGPKATARYRKLTRR